MLQRRQLACEFRLSAGLLSVQLVCRVSAIFALLSEAMSVLNILLSLPLSGFDQIKCTDSLLECNASTQEAPTCLLSTSLHIVYLGLKRTNFIQNSLNWCCCCPGGPQRPHGAFPQSAPFPPALDPHFADYMHHMSQQQVSPKVFSAFLLKMSLLCCASCCWLCNVAAPGCFAAWAFCLVRQCT